MKPEPIKLDRLEPGQQLIYGGNCVAVVSDELAARFRPDDRIVIVPDDGAVLHIPAEQHRVASVAVTAAADAFAGLAAVDDDSISRFFSVFAARLRDDVAFAAIGAANHADIESAVRRGRSTTRLELTPSMRSAMIDGLDGWAASELRRTQAIATHRHEGWTVESHRAPLGVVGFVFEGRPNVFADAAGVVRTGNTAVFRIGSDALGTARAIVEHALQPALLEAGLPEGTVTLVDSAAHAAGWALFSDRRLSLAVGRGSGPAVAQLGAVARLSGVPVSVHGTGGAWLVAGADADRERFRAAIEHSLDRKVCNTLNVCCIVRSVAEHLVPTFVAALERAAAHRGTGARLHVTPAAAHFISEAQHRQRSTVRRADGDHDEPFVTGIAVDRLGAEWEWEGSPEVSLHVVESVAEAIELCNRLSPRFVASLISASTTEHEQFFASVDAPFVGDGFTRWVDGQYALDTPELGLANWEAGRLLARGGILSGDGVYTIRYRATIDDPELHR